MKVYIAVKFQPFSSEEYVGVSKTKDGALEILKDHFPYMRGSLENQDLSSDKNNTFLLNVIEAEI